MSFSLARSFSKPLTNILSQGRYLKNHARGCRSNVTLTFGGVKLAHRGCSTRSLWQMSRTNYSNSFASTCGHRGIHTEGDKELTQFLESEIKYEEENEKTPGTLPSVNGFSISKADGSEVTLVKNADGEKVMVVFNVNHSVLDSETGDYEEQENEPQQDEAQTDQQMQSKPSLQVSITKDTETVVIQCNYPSSFGGEMERAEEGEGPEFEDALEINEVTMTKAGEEWGEKDYVVTGDNMDGNMYEMMLGMLEERGVDGAFAEQLVQFSTSYEHKQYIAFLKRLHTFTSK